MSDLLQSKPGPYKGENPRAEYMAAMDYIEALEFDIESASRSFRLASDALDALHDGIPGLDDPTTLARLRNFVDEVWKMHNA